MNNTDTETTKYIYSGFFNSKDHDRRYSALDVGKMFDGLILDGIFETIGQKFIVEADSGLSVKVGSGRAWFNHTWMYTDSYTSITVTDPGLIPIGFKRYDAVILEVNHTDEIRQASIKVISGDLAATPVKPVMQHSDGVDQYALCYIQIDRDTTEITQAMIENVIGIETAFVICPVEHITPSELLTQWGTEFQTYQSSFLSDMTTRVDEWFVNLQNELDSNQAAHLQNQIDIINQWIHDVGNAEEVAY